MSITKKPKLPRSTSTINRPFSPTTLKRAKAIAQRYQVVMWFEDGEYYGQGVELPGAGGDGKTPDECMSSARESFTALVAYMLEVGQNPPKPINGSSKTAPKASKPAMSFRKPPLSSAAERATDQFPPT